MWFHQLDKFQKNWDEWKYHFSMLNGRESLKYFMLIALRSIFFLLFICCDKSDNCKRILLKSSTSGKIVDHHLFCSPSSAHGWLKIACVWIKCDLFIGSEERERITVQTKSGWNGLKSSYQNHLTREKKQLDILHIHSWTVMKRKAI